MPPSQPEGVNPDIVPDAWLAIDLTIAFQDASWWVPFGTPVKLLRVGKAGYVVVLVSPIRGVPPRIYVPGLDSLLWDRPPPDTVARWAEYKSTFKEVFLEEHKAKWREFQEKFDLLSGRAPADSASDAESVMDRMDRRLALMDDFRRLRDASWKAAAERARSVTGWSGPNPTQVGDWIP